jgi:hypothetical protein
MCCSEFGEMERALNNELEERRGKRKRGVQW